MVYHPFRHLGLKFLSVAIAVLLWLTVAGEQVVERSMQVPLALVNMPAGVELVEPAPSVVTVRIRGTSSAVGQIAPGGLGAVLNVETGRRIYHLMPSDVRAPFGIEVLQISPGTVELRFEKTVARSVGVRVHYEGRPADGFEVGRSSVVPGSVTIEGPSSAVGSIREAVTEPIDIDGAAATVSHPVTIRVESPMVRLQAPQPASATIEIRPILMTRVLAGVRVATRDGPTKPAPTPVPATVSVEIRGPEAVVKKMTAGSLTAVADLTGLARGRHNVPVRVEPPPEVEIVQIRPADVSIRIR